jgi:hypothetical protein
MDISSTEQFAYNNRRRKIPNSPTITSFARIVFPEAIIQTLIKPIAIYAKSICTIYSYCDRMILKKYIKQLPLP